MSPTFWDQFWPALVATLIGAFVGVGLALWVDRRGKLAAARAEEKAALKALYASIGTNLEIIKFLQPMLASEGKKIPSLELDIAYLDALFPRLERVSTDPEFTVLVATYRWGVYHANRHINRLVDFGLTPFGDLHDKYAKAAFERRLKKTAQMASTMVTKVYELVSTQLGPALEVRLRPGGQDPMADQAASADGGGVTRINELNSKATQLLMFFSFAIVGAAAANTNVADTPLAKSAIAWWLLAVFPVLIGVLPLRELIGGAATGYVGLRRFKIALLFVSILVSGAGAFQFLRSVTRGGLINTLFH